MQSLSAFARKKMLHWKPFAAFAGKKMLHCKSFAAFAGKIYAPCNPSAHLLEKKWSIGSLLLHLLGKKCSIGIPQRICWKNNAPLQAFRPIRFLAKGIKGRFRAEAEPRSLKKPKKSG